jgi:hypothetical protein
MAEQLDIEAVKSEISEKANEVIGTAVEFARERPHVAVGIAFGVGWILGNGLPPRLILGAARLGWKAMLGGAVASSGLMGIFGGGDADEPETKSAGRSTTSRKATNESSGSSASSSSSRPRNGSAIKD